VLVLGWLMLVIQSVPPTYHDHGDWKLVVCTKMRLVIWKGKVFSRLTANTARCAQPVDLGPTMFDSALDWPVIDYVKFRSKNRVLWLGVQLPGPDFQHVYGTNPVIFADTPVKIMHIWRVQRRWREIRARRRNLAVCMMTHARLGKACALQAFPELVKMILA
jgi:hypothetical protein